MRFFLSKLPYAFGVVTLGVGIGMLAFAISYSILRDRYLGSGHPASQYTLEAQIYQEHQHELTLISGLTAGGVGLLTASIACFLLLAHATRSSKEAKGRLPEV